MRPLTILRTLLVWLVGVLGNVPALADAGDRTIFQWQHTAWGAKEGAPAGIIALAQTMDGYLWLGTEGGLFRFDGVSFERYEPQFPAGAAFPARTVRSLLPLPNGDLWIGFEFGGISLVRNGSITNYGTREGVPGGRVWRLEQDRGGTIWAATAAGLARLEGNRWKEVGKDWNFPGKSGQAIFLDRQGTLWVATEDTLVFLPAGAKMFQPTGIRVGRVVQISEAANGKLWMAETTRSVRPIPRAGNQQPSDETEIRVGSAGILFDREGALWITTLGDGMRRALAPERLEGKPGRFSSAVESFTAKNGLTDDVARAILQDREGNIWVGTNNGLDRFRKSNLVPIALPINLSQATFAPGDAGDLWVDSLGQIIRVHGVRAYTVTFISPPMAPASAYRDPAGVIWWVGRDAVRRFENGRFSQIALPKGFTKPYMGEIYVRQDPSGVLWAAAEREGLFYLKKGVWERVESPPELAKLTPRAAFTDWMGRVWFGYDGGTITTVKDAKIQTLSSNNQSLVGSVGAIQGRDWHIWVGGESGLALFDGSRFRLVVPGDRATFGGVLGIEETPDGGLWLCETRGVVHIPSAEVRKSLDDPSHRVQYEVFDALDGVPGAFQVLRSKEIQGTDGRLWFVGTKGVAWIDPVNISRNVLPPPVAIQSLRAGDRQYASWTNLKLPARTTNLQIGYTGLSLSIPERVRFRYKLEGMDKDWQDAGTRREAFYTNLRPGHYRFHVIACNNDGVWNESGAATEFSILPTFYQTTWFTVLCAAAAFGILWLLYLRQVRQVAAAIRGRMEERLWERERIARDLHDTLLQSFHGLMFRIQAARNMLPRRPEEAMQALDGTISTAEQAIAEGRDAIKGLRPAPVQSDLAHLLTAMGQELAGSQGAGRDSPNFRVAVEGKRQTLSPILQDEVYRIASEILRNAFQHARAHQIEAEIRYDDRVLRARIRDDGQGIDPNVLEEGGRAGHWGLAGIRERAKQIGARLDFWSETGAGTEVQLTVPAASAYEKLRDTTGFRLFRRRKAHEPRS